MPENATARLPGTRASDRRCRRGQGFPDVARPVDFRTDRINRAAPGRGGVEAVPDEDVSAETHPGTAGTSLTELLRMALSDPEPLVLRHDCGRSRNAPPG